MVQSNAASENVIEPVPALCAELKHLGCDPVVMPGRAGTTAGGVPLRVAVRRTLASDVATGNLLARIGGLLREQTPVTLSLTDLGRGETVMRLLDEICTRVRAALPADSLQAGLVGTCLNSHQLPLKAYMIICNTLFGTGPRYVGLDSLQMQHHGNQQVEDETDRNWTFLWQQRAADMTLLPVYGASVRTPCPLLADEASSSVLPAFGVHVPAETAWLPIRLDLAEMSDGRGAPDPDALHAAILGCVRIGERLLGHLYWPGPEQAGDAWINRRMAIVLEGLGDLVVERGENPSDLGCLQRVSAIVARIHTELWDASRAEARAAEPLPALINMDPSTRWDDASHRADWNNRWQRALESAAVRHRNLLVLSPYSVLPRCRDCSASFTDLLPVLEHADAFGFADPPPLPGWSVGEFKSFHRRAWAIMQRQKSASFVAAGV